MGFEIRIQKGLTKEEYSNAITEANDFITKTLERKGRFLFGGNGGWHSYLRRGIFGRITNFGEGHKSRVVFRRYQTTLKNGNTIFCIVKPDTLCLKDTGGPVNLKQCMCPKHLGGEKVKWVNDTPPETETYCVINYKYPIKEYKYPKIET